VGNGRATASKKVWTIYKAKWWSMRIYLLTIFVACHILGHGQNVRLGFRSGISFSNFYSHYVTGEIPNVALTTNPSGPMVPVVPNSPTISSYYYKTDFTQNMRAGVFTYLFVDYQIRSRLSSEIGVGYTQRGIDLEFKQFTSSTNSDNNTVNLSYSFKRNLRLDYISIPITLRYELDKKNRFYVIAGIYNSFAVNFSINESLSTTAAYASFFDSGLIAGIGFNFPLTKKMTIGLDMRSAVGMISIPKKYDEYGFQSFSSTSKNLSFETGLKLLYVLK
jgi:hypothetical protein